MIRQPDNEPDVARVALELVREPVFVVDARSERIVEVNRAACEALGSTRLELINRAWPSTRPLLGEVTLSRVDDRWTIAVAHGTVDGSAGLLAGRRDALTGLANRDALAPRGLSEDQREPIARRALLFIDLDEFKQINDTWGHAAGDHVLRVTAQRLSKSVRRRDLVVRYGGDEFLVLLDEASPRRNVKRLARRIARAVERPIRFDVHEVVVSASIGIAQCKPPGGSLDALIAEADRAMYRAKFRRRNAELGCSNAKWEQDLSRRRLGLPPRATFDR